MTLFDRRVAERFVLLDGCFNFRDLDRGLLSQARLANTDAYRGPGGQVLFGPARDTPAGVGPADQLAAFLGRPV
jgi:hypothetical protein